MDSHSRAYFSGAAVWAYRAALGKLNIHDIMIAHNVPAYIATRKWRVLTVTPQVTTPGAESVAVYDCIVYTCRVGRAVRRSRSGRCSG